MANPDWEARIGWKRASQVGARFFFGMWRGLRLCGSAFPHRAKDAADGVGIVRHDRSERLALRKRRHRQVNVGWRRLDCGGIRLRGQGHRVGADGRGDRTLRHHGSRGPAKGGSTRARCGHRLLDRGGLLDRGRCQRQDTRDGRWRSRCGRRRGLGCRQDYVGPTDQQRRRQAQTECLGAVQRAPAERRVRDGLCALFRVGLGVRDGRQIDNRRRHHGHWCRGLGGNRLRPRLRGGRR